MLKIVKYICLLLLVTCHWSYAQTERNDDLGDVSDDFQHHYFEALKQKGIENYSKAIDLLIECKTLDPNNASVHFELGKNYFEIDNYIQAEEELNKALALKPNNQWVLETLYLVYVAQQKDNEVISTLNKLKGISPKYNEDLISYYFKTRKYGEVINLIDELDSASGTTRKRERLRNQAYLYGKLFKEQAFYLEQKIDAKTASETDFASLIYAYTRLDRNNKGFEAAKVFEKSYPKSDKPHLSLYKFYLNDNQVSNAITAMQRVAESNTLKRNEKYKVVYDFLIYTEKNLEHLPDLEKAIKAFPDKSLTNQLALLYENNNNQEKSEAFIDTSDLSSSTKYEDLRLLGELLLKKNKVTEALNASSKALELYPAQPIFYLQQGKAYNLNNEPKKALESLSFGLDYLIDDVKTEVAFYKEMANAYALLKDTKNQQKYVNKAQKLNK